MDKLANDVLAAIRAGQLLPPGTAVVLGLSGGADSVCLLHVLNGLRQLLRIPELLAVHVNHGLRGTESERDEAFCRALCKAEGISFRSLRVRVQEAAAERGHTAGHSIEETARELRYAALLREAERLQAAAGMPVRIAVAHHADDQAETILLNLLRGSGLRGLSGMQALRQMTDGQEAGERDAGAQMQGSTQTQGSTQPGTCTEKDRASAVFLIRPLLTIGRAEILQYLSARKLAYVTDSSNLSTEFKRNRLRQDILPALKEINSQASKRILAAGLLCGEADSYLRTEAEAFLDAVHAVPRRYPSGLEETRREGVARRDSRQEGAMQTDTGICLGLPRRALKEKARILRGYVIMEALRRLGVPLKDWGERQIAAIDSALFAGRRYHLDLPGGVQLENEDLEILLFCSAPANKR